MTEAYYLTGTDTGAGKTFAAVALIHALRARGHRVAGMKPVASGCVATADGPRNDDALALQAASEPVPAYARINPFALTEPTAPEIAAANDGVEVGLPPILDAFQGLRRDYDRLVVEGVGGWLSPLAPNLMQANLVRALGVPVILVVGLRLGCVNHALLTLRAMREDRVVVAGWIGCTLDPELAFLGPTVAILRERLHLPCLGVLPHLWLASDAAASLELDPIEGAHAPL